VGLPIAGLAAVASGFRRVIRGRGADDQPSWLILSAAGLLLLISNSWVAVSGADPITSPSTFSIISIAVALVMATVAIVRFPGERRRGREGAIMLLDGLVAGGAFLLIASVLVYSELLRSDANQQTTAVNSVFSLIFPVLDVVLATLAVLLVVRSRPADRVKLVLVAAAFLLYAGADLAYAVRTAEGSFVFGTSIDLGWILGYLCLAAAAWVSSPEPRDGPTEPAEQVPGAVGGNLGTALVFTAFAAASLVQVLFWDRGNLQAAQSGLWVVLVFATGARQLLLANDNISLRRGLEARVAEQTTDLRRLARQNEVLITSVGDGVYGVDHAGRITFVNPSAAAMLGYEHLPDELHGRRAHDLFHAPRDDGSPYPYNGCYVHEAVSAGVVASAEEDEYIRRDGSRFTVEITASPLRTGTGDNDPRSRGAVVTFRDITQRREVERLKDEFISVVSHELRTPLTSIRGSLGLLASGRLGELPERAAPLVDVAVSSTDRLTRLINDLLDIERIQSGAKPMESAPLDVRELLESAAQQIAGLASEAGVVVEVGEAEGRALVDADQIIQTLLNLAGNAIKFSAAGQRVVMSARVDGTQVLFEVRDEGRGIPADKLDMVFERFQQVDSSDTRQKGGTGLGLAISRGIVERHGGRIWAESELGHGTTVRFTVPAAAKVTQASTEGEYDNTGAATVLVCDDDATVVDQFAILLREHGYRVVGATTGEDAIRTAAAERPQVVLLDLMMPGTTGAQVMSALREDADTHDTPVIVVSGLGPEADTSLAEDSEAWLVKPVSEKRLVQAIALAIEQRPHPVRVLLVEDDAPLSDVVTTMLEAEGMRVVHAATAADAIRLGREAPPDVVVLDLGLPDADGAEVVTALRQQLATARIPLVVYTSADLEGARADDLTLGPTVFLTKGRSTPEQLRNHVVELVAALTGGAAEPTAPSAQTVAARTPVHSSVHSRGEA
jgi:PAS domain S-box-containing protein